MKNKFLSILAITTYLILSINNSYGKNISITAKDITIDKKEQITIFREDVVIIDVNKNKIKSDFASYNKNLDLYELKNNVSIEDLKGNTLISNKAIYDKKNGFYNISGKAKFISASGYEVESSDITLNLLTKVLSSNQSTKITDIEKNLIFLDNFEYQSNLNIFKSIGNIKVKDKLDNSYNFSQIYIDEKKKEIIGTDSKVFLNDKNFKFKKANKPRIFSNAISIKNSKTKFIKSTFTICDYRDNDKCPPWELKASEMTHDNIKKTIYYKNALIKIYNIPIFFFPRLEHPDPTVSRRSGFLVPSFEDSKNLGTNLDISYFWAINNDKDLTINTRLFATEHPLFLGEYRQVYEYSNLLSDFGYTAGYKSKQKKEIQDSDRAHLFARFSQKKEKNDFEINLQHVSDKKYLKLYKIESNLVEYGTNTLENSFIFNHFEEEENLSLNFQTRIYRNLTDSYNDKYEYIFPDLSLNKSFFVEDFGYGNIQSNLRIHNFDTNKFERLLINDFEWNIDKSIKPNLINGKILTKFKNVNYEAKNILNYKEKPTSELFGAIGYLASIDLFKIKNENSRQFLTPKMLFKYSPEHMKKDTSGFTLNDRDLFTLDRLNSSNNFESGVNLTVGVDYQKNTNNNQLNFSIGQIINEKANNKMPESSSLDKRFSDIVGDMSYTNNKDFSLNYNYSIDQNYQDLNYSNFSADYFTENINFKLGYLEEEVNKVKKEYMTSSLSLKSGNSGLFSVSTKRNLIRNSSEFYKLSYEYINDCLRAGLVFRREFYEDSELEPENSLMFRVTLTPFGSISSPTVSN